VAPATDDPTLGAPSGRFAGLRAASDRVPTKWFAGIGTVLVLVVTAGFGGLAAVEAPGPDEIEAGAEYRNDQYALTVQRAVLIDELSDAGISLEDGQRVLALVVEAENLWNEPLRATLGGGLLDAVTIDGLPRGTSVARVDDATYAPWMQPGVPLEVVITWAVDAEEFADGDQLNVVLNDLSLYTASFVSAGTSWIDPVPAVTLAVAIEDLGDGANAEGADSADGAGDTDGAAG
jgi:hypothetical protein